MGTRHQDGRMQINTAIPRKAGSSRRRVDVLRRRGPGQTTPGADDAASTTRDAHEHSRTPGHAEAGRRSGRRRMAEERCVQGERRQCTRRTTPTPRTSAWCTLRTKRTRVDDSEDAILRVAAVACALLVRPGGMRGTRAYIMYI